MNPFQKISDALRPRYDPNPHRRKEVIQFLEQRPELTHREWHQRFAQEHGIPLDFVAWFRETCSHRFGYDLSRALPEDRLVDHLGLYDATFSDADWDILDDYGGRYDAQLPAGEQSTILTFGDFLKALWKHSRKPNVA